MVKVLVVILIRLVFSGTHELVAPARVDVLACAVRLARVCCSGMWLPS